MKDIFGFLTFKKVGIIEKTEARAHTTSILNGNSSDQSERSFLGAKFNNTSRNNWKSLFEVNFSKNSAKTIRLFALDFYEVIVDEAEISSS